MKDTSSDMDMYANSLNVIPVRIHGKLVGHYVIEESSKPNDSHERLEEDTSAN